MVHAKVQGDWWLISPWITTMIMIIDLLTMSWWLPRPVNSAWFVDAKLTMKVNRFMIWHKLFHSRVAPEKVTLRSNGGKTRKPLTWVTHQALTDLPLVIFPTNPLWSNGYAHAPPAGLSNCTERRSGERSGTAGVNSQQSTCTDRSKMVMMDLWGLTCGWL